MQTFLPYESFTKSASVLDMRRLGKQRVEVLQILQAIHSTQKKSWFYHPATQMWTGHINCLIEYGVTICQEWISRGYKDTCLSKIESFKTSDKSIPMWLGLEKFHSIHRGVLLDKNFEWYKQFQWQENRLEKIENRYPYFWPSKESL